MTDRKTFLEKVEEIYGEKPEYHKGRSGDDGFCDCIGLIIGALRRAGETWKGTHGSNYAARNEMASLRKISRAEDLEIGEVVYKAYDPMDDSWDLPNGYCRDEDQNDYYHVGVVTSIDPLIITHCTTPTVTKDFKIGRWAYAGRLKKVLYEGGQIMDDPKKAIVDRPAGTEGDTVNMRSGPGKDFERIDKIPFGTEIEVVKDLGEWCFIQALGRSGYMMSNYILYTGDGDTMDEPACDALPEDIREKIAEALRKIDEAGEILAFFVGRG